MTKLNTSSLASVAFALAATLGVMAIPATTMAAQIASGAARVTTAITVDYADLDLATADGQRQLDRRIRKAARAVCGGDATITGTRLRSRDAESCYDQALRQTRTLVAEKMARDQHKG